MNKKKTAIKQQALDEKYLGQKYPGTPRERMILLNNLKNMLNEHGPEWVRESRDRLLREAEYIVKEKIL